MVPLCTTIDESRMFCGRFGSCLIPRSSGKISTLDRPKPPATIIAEILPKIFRLIQKSLCHIVRPAPGLRPEYPGPIHGPGPGSEGVRVRVQKRGQKWVILAISSPKLSNFPPIFAHLNFSLSDFTKINES